MGDSLDSLAEKLAAESNEMGSGGGGQNAGHDDGGSPFGDEKRDRNLQMILDIPLKVSVELGRTRMPVRELINLAQGSVIELNKLAGEPLEVYVNDKLIARGEAVVVNEKFGVRLTDIISQSERVEQLS
jgi:flagellar motor switch protein FliN/FliY